MFGCTVGTRTLIAEVRATVQEITSPANTEPLKTQAKLPDSSNRPNNVSVAADTDCTDSARHTAGECLLTIIAIYH